MSIIFNEFVDKLKIPISLIKYMYMCILSTQNHLLVHVLLYCI